MVALKKKERVTNRKGMQAHLSISMCYVCRERDYLKRKKRSENGKKENNKKRVTRESQSLDTLVHFLIVVVDL